jgi:hypothetical protein
MKKTDYLFIGVFIAAIFAALIALRIVPCSPLKVFSTSSIDSAEATSCKKLGAIEF